MSELFDIWAPPDIEWSRWAKPVLFAQLAALQSSEGGLPVGEPIDTSFAPEPRRNVALVVDLPGQEAVRTGVALVQHGYWPVPLFNVNHGPLAVVEVESIMRALRAGAEVLRAARLEPDVPPAFLLDADRMAPAVLRTPGRFDNRWIVLPQDFPSATYLRSKGVSDVLLVHRGGDAPREDLAHVLLRWQESGISLLHVDVAAPGRPSRLKVTRPRWYRRAWYRWIALLGLRRSNAGGFGALIPVVTAGVG
jgi:hypothetical protein